MASESLNQLFSREHVFWMPASLLGRDHRVSCNGCPRQKEDMLQFTPSCPEDDGKGLEGEQQGEPSSQAGLCSRKGAGEGGLCPSLGGNSVSGCSGPTEPTQPLPPTPGLLGKAEKSQKFSFPSQLTAVPTGLAARL